MKKFEYLESLRGLASLTVVFAHFVVGFYPTLYYGSTASGYVPTVFEVMISRTPLNLIYNGTFSVAIFFVLSGYVLTYKFFRNRERDVTLVPLAVKRYVRLLLPVLLSVFLSYVILRLNWYYRQAGGTNPWLAGLWNFDANFWSMLKEALYGVLLRRDVTYNRVLWTMNIELLGSLLVYLFVFLFRNSSRRSIAYIICIVFFRHAHYLAFIFGMLLADLNGREEGWFRKINNQALFMVLLAFGLFLGSHPDQLPVKGTMYGFLEGWLRIREYHILGAALIMTALLKLPWLQSLLSLKPLVLLGKISFSLYLLHVIIMGSLGNHLFVALAGHLSYRAAFVWTFSITMPVIFGASYLAYRYVDAPSVVASQAAYDRTLRLVQRLGPTLFKKNSEQQTAAPPESAKNNQP